jgi:hypothetical protein
MVFLYLTNRDEFKSVKNIPDDEKKILYDEICHATFRYNHRFDHTLSENFKNYMELPEASINAISYSKEIFLKNKDLLKEVFLPETDNAMEQIFSFICGIINTARSFKSSSGLASFCYNLFTYFNNRFFSYWEMEKFFAFNKGKITVRINKENSSL